MRSLASSVARSSSADLTRTHEPGANADGWPSGSRGGGGLIRRLMPDLTPSPRSSRPRTRPTRVWAPMMSARWQLRGSAYAYFMSDRYPPWEWG